MKTRRGALRLGAAVALAAALPLRAAVAGRVVIVGAGWGGLAAATRLVQETPGLDVTVIDRQATFRSLPLSNPWLCGQGPEGLAPQPLAALATRGGWLFVAAEVTAIERERRLVVTPGGSHGYDALLLAPGAVANHSAWFGDDERASAECRSRWSAGFVADELDGLRKRLQAFEGGEIVMTVPSPPLRCPPAPYERALFIAMLIRRRGLRARLTVLDAGPGMPRFNRIFADHFAREIEHRPYVQLQQVDPFQRKLASSEGDLRWDEALLLPSLHADALVRRAGLAAQDSQGRAIGWAAVDGDTLRSPADARIWIVGDAMHEVSPLFGAYPKTAAIAADLGAAAAVQIAAALRGDSAPPAELPRSDCHVWTSIVPPEQLQLQASYRRRGDGLIVQALKQADNPQPRGEDSAWLRGLLRLRLGID